MTLGRLGWLRFDHDPAVAAWVEAVRPTAMAIAANPIHREDWLRHGGTWFAGVNLLPNDPNGSVAGSPPLTGAIVDAARSIAGDVSLDQGQISVCYPGYPRQDPAESDAAHRFRRFRDAAHVDGLIPRGPGKRRHLEEHHAFVMGLPMTRSDPGAAPLVVWEGSHKIMAEAFATAFDGVAPERWIDLDVTEMYQAARARCFDVCRRIEVHAAPGEGYLVHRLALHGVAPWADTAGADHAGRAIVYFRPEMNNPKHWCVV